MWRCCAFIAVLESLGHKVAVASGPEHGSHSASPATATVATWEQRRETHIRMVLDWFSQGFLVVDHEIPASATRLVGKGEMKSNKFIVEFNPMTWWEEHEKERSASPLLSLSTESPELPYAVPRAVMSAVSRSLSVRASSWAASRRLFQAPLCPLCICVW